MQNSYMTADDIEVGVGNKSQYGCLGFCINSNLKEIALQIYINYSIIYLNI